MSSKPLKGWRFAVLVGGLVGALGAACYPIILAPMQNPEPWQKISHEIRQKHNIKQENIQPGNMKVWTDPFDREGKPGHKAPAHPDSPPKSA